MSENNGQTVSVAAFLGTFGAGLTTIASVISDVLTPLAPVSLYLGLLALVALIASIFCVRSASINAWFDSHLPGIWFKPFAAALGIAVTGLFTTYFLSASHKEAGGFLADTVPAIAMMQGDLGLVAEHTARIAKSTEAIEGHTRDISSKMDDVKREVSENPRKELANLGIEWKPDAFLEAVSIGDLGTVQLFVDGGMPLTAARSQGRPLPIMLAKNTTNPGAILDLLVESGLDVNHVYDSNSSIGPKSYTILNWAVEKNNQSLLRSLVRHGGSLDMEIGAFGALGTSYRSYALGLSLQNNDFDLTRLLLDLGADKSVGEYNAYSVALAKQAKLPAGEQRDALEKLMERLEPPDKIRKQQELRQRLAEVEKELTSVAMEGLRAVTASEKVRTDRRYDELQVERKKLQKTLGIEAK